MKFDNIDTLILLLIVFVLFIFNFSLSISAVSGFGRYFDEKYGFDDTVAEGSSKGVLGASTSIQNNEAEKTKLGRYTEPSPKYKPRKEKIDDFKKMVTNILQESRVDLIQYQTQKTDILGLVTEKSEDGPIEPTYDLSTLKGSILYAKTIEN